MTTAALIDTLREAGADFEFYPTTDEMIQVVIKHLTKTHRPWNRDDEKMSLGALLDIGAGDGRVLKAFAEACYCSGLYAIEKSAPLIEQMPANIAIVGTDFETQTLIDKDVDIIFCNPPYSKYEEWVVKIIKEGLCNEVYLILPRRWKQSKPIKAALESREAKAKTLWSGDFATAERKARAVVDILCVTLCEREYDGDTRPHKKDPFDTWFHETFPEIEAIDQCKGTDEEERHWEKPRISADLLVGYNLVDRLVELYLNEMKSKHASYRALCSIDPGLLAEVGVKVAEVKEGLRKKISGLKNKYWQELFDHLDKITKRLCTRSRAAIVQKMGSAVNVDFTVDNAYAVVLWVLKNANEYIDSQVVDLFKDLSRPENITNYKSNQKTWDAERWRYLQNPDWNHGKQETPSRYMLEYRIITQKWHAIRNGDESSWDYENNLSETCHDFLGDIVTVANNLGFPCSDTSRSRFWSSGSPMEFYLDNDEVLMRVKAHMNGNLHIQFNQDFIKALNVEASRLLGWIRSPKEAVEEMGIDFVTAERAFQSNRIFAPSECKLLTAGEAT